MYANKKKEKNKTFAYYLAVLIGRAVYIGTIMLDFYPFWHLIIIIIWTCLCLCRWRLSYFLSFISVLIIFFFLKKKAPKYHVYHYCWQKRLFSDRLMRSSNSLLYLLKVLVTTMKMRKEKPQRPFYFFFTSI